MRAEECLREGDLNNALDQLQAQVRKDPSNAKYRIFLFQLLSVLGQWERALTQLNVAGELDTGALAMVQTYREALRCEVFRGEVFNGQRSPLIFGKPTQWFALLMEALRMTIAERYAEAKQLRDQAFDLAPTTSGEIDGDPFQWIADGDTRLGPVLEAVVNGRYYWIPFDHISTIAVEKPVDLRDLVWMPAHFKWANGGESVGLIPTRYPNSQQNEDNAIRMARRTEWVDLSVGTFFGYGQRMLVTDAGEYSLMDVRLISLNVESQSAEAMSAADAPAG